MKNYKVLFVLTAIVLFILFACEMPTALSPFTPPTTPTPTSGPGSASEFGSISGKAYLINRSDHGGINIMLEKTDGLRSASVTAQSRSLAAGSRSIGSPSFLDSTQTDSSGTYTFNNVSPGLYTIYAHHPELGEKAVTINSVAVQAGGTATAPAMSLTPTGNITGRIKLDGNETGNWGFLVSIAGTSYMAVTADDGRFTISGVPEGDGYSIIIMKGSYIDFWSASPVSVSGGAITTLSPNPREITINGGLPITEVGNIGFYLDSQTNGGSENDPVYLPLRIILSETNWRLILAAIENAGKFVDLDLAECTRTASNFGGGLRSDGTFDPIYTLSAANVVSLVLPDAAVSIVSGNVVLGAIIDPFTSFSKLRAVSGKVTSIGDYAFYGHTSLTSVDFPVVTDIGNDAFYECTSLVSVSFPEATKVRGFNDCTNLVSVSLPKATEVGGFDNCTSLVSVDFPEAIIVVGFRYCTSLTSVSLPKVNAFYYGVFDWCTSLCIITIGANVRFHAAYVGGIEDYYNDKGQLAGTYYYIDGTGWTGP